MTKKNKHELSIETKAIIIGMFKAGKMCSAIAWDLKHAQTTVSSIICRFKTCQALNKRNLRVLVHELKRTVVPRWPTLLTSSPFKSQHALPATKPMRLASTVEWQSKNHLSLKTNALIN